ncbi:MAG: hypothetical protein RBS08_04095 [Bdellovibrionales bacterium]|nr:hypothetical protein [Bdellovibrionales bacterium]
MVKIRREGGKNTWLLEEDTLSGRLGELAIIFKHHSKPGGERMDERFMSEVLSLQAEALAHMAEKQEQELERLRRVENELALLRTEFKSEMEKIKNPPSGVLDKSSMRKPSSGKP